MSELSVNQLFNEFDKSQSSSEGLSVGQMLDQRKAKREEEEKMSKYNYPETAKKLIKVKGAFGRDVLRVELGAPKLETYHIKKITEAINDLDYTLIKLTHGKYEVKPMSEFEKKYSKPEPVPEPVPKPMPKEAFKKPSPLVVPTDLAECVVNDPKLITHLNNFFVEYSIPLKFVISDVKLISTTEA